MYIQEGSEIIHLTSKQLYIRVNIVAGETDAHSFLGFTVSTIDTNRQTIMVDRTHLAGSIFQDDDL